MPRHASLQCVSKNERARCRRCGRRASKVRKTLVLMMLVCCSHTRTLVMKTCQKSALWEASNTCASVLRDKILQGLG